MLHEFKAGLEHYFATRPPASDQPRNLDELVAFNDAHAARRARCSSARKRCSLASSVGGLDDPAYLEARASQLATGAPGRDRCRPRERSPGRARLPDDGAGMAASTT